MQRTGRLFYLTAILLLLITTAFNPAPSAAMHSTNENAIPNGEGTTLKISVPWDQLKVEIITVEGRQYSQVSLPDWSQTTQAGAPVLPMLVKNFGAPFGGAVSVSVTPGPAHTQVLSSPLLPAVTQLVDYGLPEDEGGEVPLPLPVFTYAEDPAIYGSANPFPGELARISGDGIMRQQRVVGVAVYPVQYNPQTLELTVYESLQIEVIFEGGISIQGLAKTPPESEAFENLLSGELLNYEEARPWRQADDGSISIQREEDTPGGAWSPPDPGWRIKVRQDGMYKLSYDELEAVGVPVTSLNPNTLKMYHLGAEIAILVDLSRGSSSSAFDSGDFLVFYGQGLDSKYTYDNVYWLTYGGSDGLRMQPRDGTPVVTDTPVSYPAALHMEENINYWGLVPGDEKLDRYMWKFIRRPNVITFTHTYTLTEPYTGQAASITLSMVGYTAGLHTVAFSMNGTPIGSTNWSGVTWQEFTTTIPAGILQAGTNTLFAELVVNASSTDLVYFNWVELDFPNNFQAENNQLLFDYDTAGTWTYQVDGFSGYNSSTNPLAVFDISSPSSVVQITGVDVPGTGPDYYARFQDTVASPKSYWAGLQTAYRSVQAIEADTASNLLSTSNTADHITIYYKGALVNFSNAAETLRAFRHTPSKPAVKVDVQDIYDEFNYGIAGAEPIHDFLAYAYSSWTAPAPSFVVLIGDGTNDPKNYRGLGRTSFIHPYLAPVDPWIGETAADNRYVTLVGNDTMPDMALGRLSVNTEAEAAGYVSKIINYEGLAGLWQQRVLVVADNADSGGNFAALSDDLINCCLPASYTAEKVYYGVTHTSAADAQAAIKAGINAGKLIVNYIGHAAYTTWAGELLFRTTDVAGLTNSSFPQIVLAMTCYEGYYQRPDPYTANNEALGEVVTRAAGKGAVASWSPTGLGVATGHDYLNRGFFNALFTNGIKTVGGAAVAGKLNLFLAGGAQDLLDTYILFGDPATKVNLQPTAIDLLEFTATPSKKDVLLKWETVSETDNLGFNLYRAVSESGEKVKLNSEMIPTQTNPGSTDGSVYNFTDEDAFKINTTLYYWLEDVDIYNISTWHGPVMVQSEEIKFELMSFGATGAKNSVVLEWETANEDMVAGYNVLRATTKNGKKIQINVEQILPLGDGGSYTYTDTGRGLKPALLRPNKTYYYWLEVMGTNNAVEEYGPVQAKVLKEVRPTPTPKPKPTARPIPTSRPGGTFWNWGR